jgi:endonuclease/exonuclease/phosphatase family metal-dependent hydrolase
VRFLTLNVKGFDAGVDRVASAIGASDPDVAALQEVYRGPAQDLARMIGYHLGFAATRPLKEFGNAILARQPVGEYWKIRLPRTRGLVRRGGVGAQLPDGTQVISIHLGLSGAERERHAAELLRHAPGHPDERTVICGDLNEGPRGAAYRSIAARFTDVFGAVGERGGETFPATAPTERLDFVFCSRDLTPVRAAVVPVVASDHLAVVAEIEVPEEPG